MPSLSAEVSHQVSLADREKKVAAWRKERDDFFKNHHRSPLEPEDKRTFSGLSYFPYNPKCVFVGKIKRCVVDIQCPQNVMTFLTNKGTNKRYVKYGHFRFELDGKGYTLQIFRSLLSDYLMIPFRDATNGKETYPGGRYLDAEILPGYELVLDFNMAYSPPCAYNDTLVCVIPPKEHTLDREIQAGEKKFK